MTTPTLSSKLEYPDDLPQKNDMNKYEIQIQTKNRINRLNNYEYEQ